MDTVGQNRIKGDCECLTISKLFNITDCSIIEKTTIETEVKKRYHLKAGCYNLNDLCKKLTDLCKNADFEVIKISTENKFEGQIKIKKNTFFDHLKNLTYEIPNVLAYILGIISYSDIFINGVNENTQFTLVKDGKLVELKRDASLLKHMHFLQLSSNFMLVREKHISYIQLSKDDLVNIFEDKLTIYPKNLRNNLISFSSIGES